MASVNALSVALFNAAAGGYSADMQANPAAYAAVAGAVLEKNLSSNAAFVQHLLANFGIASSNPVFAEAQTALTAMVNASGRANATVSAIDFLATVPRDSAFASVANAFFAKVDAAAAFSRANTTELDVSKLISGVTGVDTDVVAAAASFAAGAASRDTEVNGLQVSVTGLRAELAAAQAATTTATTAAATAKTAADAAAANAAADLTAANNTIRLIDDTAFASESAAAAAAKAAAEAVAKTAADAAAKTAADAATAAAATLKAAQDAAATAKTAADAAAAKAAADLTAANTTITALQNPAPRTDALTVDANLATAAIDADVFVGVSGGNDSFTGTSASLNGDIIIDGSRTDNDTLTINGLAFANAVTTVGSTITGIENIRVNFDALTNATFNMNGVIDAPSVTVSNVRAGATSLVTVSEAKSGTVINAGTGLAGGLTVTMSAADMNTTVNSAGVTGTTTVTTTGTGSMTVNSGTDALTLNSADGNIVVNAAGAAAGAISATSTGVAAGVVGNVTITANAATGAVTGVSGDGSVTVSANASTGTVTATATAGAAVVNANTTAAITATGTSINITSANAGTVAAPTVIAVNGSAGTADAATITANGIVTLTNNADLESLNLSGNTAAVTYTVAVAETIVVTGSQNVTLSGTEAVLSASRVSETNTAVVTANVTDAGTGADYSRVAVDRVNHAVAVGAGTYTYANGANVTLAANPAAITLDINDNDAATTLAGTLNVTLGANTLGVITVNNAADEIDTLNITASIAQTALDIRGDNTALTGDTINILGSRAVVVAPGTTALALNASAATGAITATSGANILTVNGGTAADTLTATFNVANTSVSGNGGNDNIIVEGAYLATQSINGGDGTDTLTAGVATDISLATVTGIEIVAQGANTFRLSSAQATNGLLFTGAGAVTISNLAASVDFSGLIFADAAANTVISSANTNAAVGAAAPRTFIGTSAIDVMTGGDGADVLSGLAGNDILIGGLGADALIGGAGSNTYRYVAAADAPAGETITFNQTVGAVETIDVIGAGATAVNLSLVNAGALLTGLDAISIGEADTATFSGAQLTGLTLAVTGGAGSTLAVVGSTTAANTINLANATVTTAVVTIAGGAAVDTITGTTGADTITGLAGNDVLSGGAGNDTIDGGADDDTITGGNGADILIGGAGADTIILTETASSIDTVLINASTTGLTSDSGSVVVAGANNDLGQDTVTGFVVGTDVIRIVNATQGGFVHGTHTGVGTANSAATTSTGIAGDYAATVGLVDLNANGAFNNPMDVAITFGTALSKGDFEAALQYNVTLIAGGVAFTGGAQADTITGGTGADTIVGGAGNDTITGGAGTDTITIGIGQDTVDLTEAVAVADTLVWGTAFAAGNANAATVTGFAFAAGADLFDLTVNLSNGTTAATSALVLLAPVAQAANASATENDVIFTFNGAGDLLAAGTTVANAVANAVTALTSTTDFAVANVATGDSFLLQMNDGTNTFVFHYVADGTAATTTAADLALIGVFNGTVVQALTGDFI